MQLYQRTRERMILRLTQSEAFQVNCAAKLTRSEAKAQESRLILSPYPGPANQIMTFHLNPKAFYAKSEKLISIQSQKGGSVTCGSFCVTGTEKGGGGMGVVLFPISLVAYHWKSLSTTRLVSLLFHRFSTPCTCLSLHRCLRTPVRYTNVTSLPLHLHKTATLRFSRSFR